MAVQNPHVVIISFHLEAHALAPASEMKDFRELTYLVGDKVSDMARTTSSIAAEVKGFYAEMDGGGDWTALPTIVMATPPGGTCRAEVWQHFLTEIKTAMAGFDRIDAVYLANHGASTAEGVEDTEKDLIEMVRGLAPAGTPIFASYDLHGNISADCAELLTGFVSYRTDPHVDQFECGQAIARMVRQHLAGEQLCVHAIKLPFVPASLSVSTTSEPYASVIKLADRMVQTGRGSGLANVAILAGFPHSNHHKCGMLVASTATTRQVAEQSAAELAQYIWDNRANFKNIGLSLDEVSELLRRRKSGVILADVSDNPGGGGSAKTLWLLEHLHGLKQQGVLGLFHGQALVEQARQTGIGKVFSATFVSDDRIAPGSFTAQARVLSLTDGVCVGRRGIRKGVKLSMGNTALIELIASGLKVVVTSLRRQLVDPQMLEIHGLDLSQVPVLVVKSRWHYRAGFDELFADENIHSVIVPGMTSPDLSALGYDKLPRPSYPMDPETEFTITRHAG